ncbi:MAG: hypothetical protein HQL47_02940 [Gammaproteobacteria bacterium]|nr:hypothetical protein [Gammaproteobacteria bacterium]
MSHYRWMKNRNRNHRISSALAASPIGAGAAVKGGLIMKGALLAKLGLGLASLVPGVIAVAGGVALHQSFVQRNKGMSA